MKRFLSFISIPVAILFTSILPAEEKFAAFVAVASDYSGNAALYEANDNADILTATIEELGFKVTKCLNFSKQEFLTSYEAWCKETANAEIALVYLSGHGGSSRAENYLFPIGTDFSNLRQFARECIPIGATLGQLANSSQSDKRLNLFIFDGPRENPFLARAKTFDEGRPNPSAFHSFGYVPRNTIAILPAQPDKLVSPETSSIFVEALKDHFFKSADYKEGIAAMKRQSILRSFGKISPKVYSEFHGTLSFSENQISLEIPDLDELDQFQQVRQRASSLLKSGRLEDSIIALEECFDSYPDKREIVISDLQNVLTLAPIKDALVGKALIESDKISLERLASNEETDGKEGLNIQEARRIFSSTGVLFPEHQDSGKRFAMIDAEAGDLEAMVFLARIYLNDETSESDAEAQRWLKKAADGDYVDAVNWLGDLYRLGRGAEKSPEKAKEFFERSRDLGSAEGIAGLGYLEYEKQQGLPEDERDFHNAIQLYETAIERKNYQPAAQLGHYYFFELLELETALKILSKGAFDAVDSRNLYGLYEFLNVVEKANLAAPTPAMARVNSAFSKEERRELLLMAADLGNSDAITIAREEDLDYLGAAKPLCDENGLSYEFWKIKQRKRNERFREDR